MKKEEIQEKIEKAKKTLKNINNIVKIFSAKKEELNKDSDINLVIEHVKKEMKQEQEKQEIQKRIDKTITIIVVMLSTIMWILLGFGNIVGRLCFMWILLSLFESISKKIGE